MRWWWTWCALVLGGCALFRTTQPVVDGVQAGVASWYGPGFHGKRTANGEIYDQYELTAAHRTLPLGTRVLVTNLTNGRAVEVRINDRGPFIDGRAIDLSYAAARMIDMVGPGTARVRIAVLGTAPHVLEASVRVPRLPRRRPEARETTVVGRRQAPIAPRLPPLDEPTGRFEVEIASLSSAARAEHLRDVLASRFPDAHVSPLEGAGTIYYRVRIGPYPLRGLAVARGELVNRLGYPAVLVEEPAS